MFESNWINYLRSSLIRCPYDKLSVNITYMNTTEDIWNMRYGRKQRRFIYIRTFFYCDAYYIPVKFSPVSSIFQNIFHHSIFVNICSLKLVSTSNWTDHRHDTPSFHSPQTLPPLEQKWKSTEIIPSYFFVNWTRKLYDS